MAATTTTTTGAPPGTGVPRRWAALSFIALAQLMVVLDATVVNIALPSAQKALDISDGNRQWVITAYTLAFGGLLLFGGRIADLVGRKQTFLIGLLGFAGASALGGAAVNAGMLLGARALQGSFGALLAPSALSLLTVMFTEPKERAKAFGIYGAIAGGGAALGLILGGVLTEYLNWRWALYVNVPIAVVAFIGALAFLHVSASSRNRARLDIPGVVLVTAGLVSLVYGFTRAESDGWSDRSVIGLFVAAGVLLIAFVAVESRVKAPLLPLRVVLDRNRGGAYLAVGLAVIAMFGLFLFLTYYLQVVKGYSPVKTGLAFLPMVAGMITGSTQISARLMHRVAPRALMLPGLLCATAGMVILTQLKVDSSYASMVLPAQVLLGLGLGCNMMPAMNLATTGVAPQEAGVASAMINTSQQVGGSIGTAMLNTIAATATTHYLTHHTHGRPTPHLAAVGMVHGFTVALWWAVGILGLAALIVAVLVNRKGEGRRAAASQSGNGVDGAEGIPAQRSRELASTGIRTAESDRPSVQGQSSDVTVAVASAEEARDGGPGAEIRGYVRGSGAAPVPGATLTLIDLSGHQVGRAAAHGDGSYALTAPGAGSYVLVTASSGHQPQAATLMVGNEPLVHDVNLAGTSCLTGVVRSASTGAPIGGAMVVVTDVRGQVIASGKTSEDGGFSFADLTSGTFTVAVSAESHRPTALPIEVVGQGITPCTVELQVGAQVQGTVRAGSENRPLADARVTLLDSGGNVVGTATTGLDGEYAFTDLDTGEYTMIASGYPPVATTLTVDGIGESGFDLQLGHP